MDDDIQSQTTGVHYVSNTRHQRAGQDGDDRARGALDVEQLVALRNEGFAGHVWPEQQASGAILEIAGMFNNPQMIYQFYPYQYYTMWPSKTFVLYIKHCDLYSRDTFAIWINVTKPKHV